MGATEDAGRIGCVLICTGMIGSVLCGWILDKNHKYKECTLLLFIGTTLSIAGLIFSLEWRSLICCYITAGFIGFFSTAYMTVGLELAIEITYPLEETTVSGILFSVTQIFSIIFTILFGHLNFTFGSFWSLISQCIAMCLGIIITAFVPKKLNRQEAFGNDDTSME